MATAEAFDVIEAALRTGWGETTPIVFENEDFQLADQPSHFLFVEVIGGVFGQASIGGGDQVDDNLWREVGMVMLHVMTRRNIGSRTARHLAKQAADILRGKDIAGVTFRDAEIGAGEAGKADGNYWRMTATVDFQRDE